MESTQTEINIFLKEPNDAEKLLQPLLNRNSLKKIELTVSDAYEHKGKFDKKLLDMLNESVKNAVSAESFSLHLDLNKSHWKIFGSIAETLNSLTALKHLSVIFASKCNESFVLMESVFPKLEKLESLSVEFSDSMAWENLELRHIQSGAAALKKMDQLKSFSLYLEHITVGERVCRVFGEAIAELPLENISFHTDHYAYTSGTDLGDFWEPLKNSKKMKSASIHFCSGNGPEDFSKISSSAVKTFDSLQRMQSLEKLEINLENNISDEAVNSLAASLGHLEKLTDLKISLRLNENRNPEKITKALTGLNQLKDLDLNLQNTALNSVPALLTHLAECSSLRNLILNLPSPDHKMIDPLILIVKNLKLERAYLDCSYHSWSLDEYAKLVDEGLMKTTSLKYLYLALTEGALMFDPKVYESAERLKKVIPEVFITNRDIN
ncbi:MAG TPA: hypothetical protein PKN56_14500 [Leptospiraceae bacterium]|nr:hypothetical protein [Leptospiraceae bacterium]